ncbi:MAG: NAD(P)H-dependent oxidoreductase subunit E [Dehalococcoidia bacterium]
MSELRETHGYKTQTEVVLDALESLAGRSSASFGSKLSHGVEPHEREEVMRKVIATASKVDEIIDKHDKNDSHLIQIMLEIQREYNWLPKEALLWLSERLGVSINQIYQIATFYKAFSLVPRGRHLVRVCMGTACHVRGAMRLLDRTTQVLGIEPGENSKDMRFSLETVNCLGCCAMGPAMVIDEETLSNPSVSELEKAFGSRE